MRIDLNNKYKVTFGGHIYHTDATSECDAKTKIYNKLKKTEPTFVGDSFVNTNDMKVRSLFK